MRLSLVLCLLFVSLPATVAANALRGSESPYLAMHGDDPVDWQPWSAEVLVRARREGRLIFVSSGYFACHWCHVMQRETYRDPEVARFLRRHFIAVKLDRELNPALDAYLIDFVTRTRGTAGWPLNVFLTPEGNPLVGATYLPRDRFLALLEQLVEQWQETPDYLAEAARQAALVLADVPRAAEPPPTAGDARRYLRRLVGQALEVGDEMSGGFGEQGKFPMVPHLQALIEAWRLSPEPALREFLLLTLDQMASQGLRDHLGGGFFRYTVDPGWQTPHFEKMLYGNALLAALYLQAAEVFDRPDYREVARDTLDFMLDRMRAPGGGLVASLSAVDAEGVEGGHYLWDEATLRRLLEPRERVLVQRLWGMQGSPPFEAGHLPRVQMDLAEAARELGMAEAEAAERFAAARRKLLAERERRKLPVDDKVLAGWNGLALSALVDGARILGQPRYRVAARELRNLLIERLWDGRRLLRARGRQGELGQAALQDYAYAARGLLDWSELVDSRADRRLARRWVDEAWRRFHDDSGWRLGDRTRLPGMHGVALLEDSPLPSPSVVLMDTARRLARDDEARRRLREVAARGHTRLDEAAFEHPGQVMLLTRLWPAPGDSR